MRVILTAFGRLHGECELPDNWDLNTDIHLPFNERVHRCQFDGTALAPMPVNIKKAVFRWSGYYSSMEGGDPLKPFARYHLVDLIQ